MNRNTWKLLTALIVLAAVYVWQFSDLFRKPHIQISVSSRPGFAASEPGSAATVIFGLDRDYVLDKVRVLSLASVTTNASPLEVWTLSRKGAVPQVGGVRGFAYGAHLDGMTPTKPSLEGLPLVPGLPYRLEISSGSLVGSVDFVPRAVAE